MMNKKNAIREYIENLNADQKVQLWNEYCDADKRFEDKIFPMGLLNDCFYGVQPLEIIDKCSDINIHDDYFCETMWGLESGDCPEDFSCYDEDDLIDYINDENDALNDDGLKAVFDEYAPIGELLNELNAEELTEDLIGENWQAVIESDIDYNIIAEVIGWSFIDDDLKQLAKIHENGDEYDRKKIEDLLTECNFHTECKKFQEGEY